LIVHFLLKRVAKGEREFTVLGKWQLGATLLFDYENRELARCGNSRWIKAR